MKVVFVQGPTASGKSSLALQWAQKFDGVIVNCDSIQCYQELNIGSAKPPLSERTLVPHFLFDYVPAGEVHTAGDYRRDFFKCLAQLPPESRIFVVGGTGFYFQAIEKGMYDVAPSDPAAIELIERELKEFGPDRLYAELQKSDPEAAGRFSKNDSYRLVRSIEVLRKHGRTISDIRREHETKESFPYPLLKLGIWGSRFELEPRVLERTQKMLQEGLIQEVESLLARGLGSWKAMQSVGYREVLEYLQSPSEISGLKNLEQQIVTSTLQLAKRQRTWFQRDPDIYWRLTSDEEAAAMPPSLRGHRCSDMESKITSFFLA